MSDAVHVLIEAELLAAEDGGLRGPIVDGWRSLVMRFAGSPARAEPMGFTNVIYGISEGGAPGHVLRASVWFLSPDAESYATPGSEFEFWYGRTVGYGRVVEGEPALLNGAAGLDRHSEESSTTSTTQSDGSTDVP